MIYEKKAYEDAKSTFWKWVDDESLYVRAAKSSEEKDKERMKAKGGKPVLDVCPHRPIQHFLFTCISNYFHAWYSG